jgi:hypothetical protein
LEGIGRELTEVLSIWLEGLRKATKTQSRYTVSRRRLELGRLKERLPLQTTLLRGYSTVPCNIKVANRSRQPELVTSL